MRARWKKILNTALVISLVILIPVVILGIIYFLGSIIFTIVASLLISVFIALFLINMSKKERKQVFYESIFGVLDLIKWIAILCLLILFIPLLVINLALMYPIFVLDPETTTGVATVAMVIAITMSIIIGAFSHKDMLRHNKQILEEMRKSYIPILKIRVRVEVYISDSKDAEDRGDRSFHIKNIGPGPATNVRMSFYRIRENMGEIKKEGAAADRPNIIEWCIPPIGAGEELDVGTYVISPKDEETILYVKILCKDVSEEKNYEFYYKICLVEFSLQFDCTMREADKEEYDKWSKA